MTLTGRLPTATGLPSTVAWGVLAPPAPAAPPVDAVVDAGSPSSPPAITITAITAAITPAPISPNSSPRERLAGGGRRSGVGGAWPASVVALAVSGSAAARSADVVASGGPGAAAPTA